MLSFREWPIWLNILLLCASAAAIWTAGTRLAAYVDGIAD
jgi:hypothetical protein